MILYIIQTCLLAILSVILLCYYCHGSVPYYVRVLVFLSFFLCMMGFMMLPIDIYATSTDSDYQSVISVTWTVIYYINFFTCWLVLPLAQEY